MKKNISIVLALLLVLTIQLGFSENAYAESNLPDGTYEVPVEMMKADDITASSMASGALVSPGHLEVINGEWFLRVEFQTLYIGFISGNASNIQYYEGAVGTPLHNAEVLSYWDNGEVKEVRMPVEQNSEGVYVKMHVEAGWFITMDPNAYIKYAVPKGYEITANAGAHGSISPAGAVTIVEGASQSFTITPDAGYHVKDVKVDNVSVGAVTSHEITNVMADHTIVAEFEKDAPVEHTITAGADQTMVEGNKNILDIVCNGDFDEFQGIWFDGIELEEGSDKDYTAMSGSTIVTFTDSYLSNLAVGTHDVEFRYTKNRNVNTTLTVTAKEETGGSLPSDNTLTAGTVTKVDSSKTKEHQPATGDTNTPYVMILLLGISALLVSAMRRKKFTK